MSSPGKSAPFALTPSSATGRRCLVTASVRAHGVLFRLVPLIFWYDKSRYEGASASDAHDGYQYTSLDPGSINDDTERGAQGVAPRRRPIRGADGGRA